MAPRGWRAIEAATFVDLDILYTISGAAGREFWERLGFRVAGTCVEPELLKESDLLNPMRNEAAARGIAPERLAERYTMRLELVPWTRRPPWGMLETEGEGDPRRTGGGELES